MDEILDLYAVSLHPPGVEWVDGFDGMEDVIRYLKSRPDSERTYTVTDIGHNIRAVMMFGGDGRLLVAGPPGDAT